MDCSQKSVTVLALPILYVVGKLLRVFLCRLRVLGEARVGAPDVDGIGCVVSFEGSGDARVCAPDVDGIGSVVSFGQEITNVVLEVVLPWSFCGCRPAAVEVRSLRCLFDCLVTRDREWLLFGMMKWCEAAML
jgi:hypothetical protein